MADQKVSDLPSLNGADVDPADLLYIIDSSAGSTGSKKITVGQYQLAPVSGGTANGVVYLNGSKVVTTGSGLVFDGSNLGLGATPSAWGAGYAAFQVKSGGVALWSDGTQRFFLSANVYYDGTNRRYQTTGVATEYVQNGGAHQWYTAPSGTAGNAISFGDAKMTLDASGYLGIATSSPTCKLDVRGASGIGVQFFETSSGNSTRVQLGTASGVGYIDANAGVGSIALGFNVASTERARITSGGKVYIAGTTDQGAYNLQVNGTGVWGAGAYVNGSDERLKDNIQTLNDGLAVVSQLRPVTFQYKPEHSKNQSIQPGFIAQELQQAMAGKDYVDGVVVQGPEYLNVAYQNLIPILTKAIQEQQSIIEDLRARVAALESA